MSLTIIITNKDDGATLPRQLNSIINQTVLPDELILVDDGSSDNSKFLMSEFRDKHQNLLDIQLIFHDENKGFNERTNEAILESTSEYFYMGSANDYLLPEFVENLKRGISSGAAIVSCCRDFVELEEGVYVGKELMSDGYYIGGHTSCVKKEYAKNFGLIDTATKWHGDWFLYHAICLSYDVYCVPKELSVMTYHAGKMSCGAYTEEEVDVLNHIINKIRSNSSYEKIQSDFIPHILHIAKCFQVDIKRLSL